MLEELRAGLVDGGDGGIGFERPLAWDLLGKVFARVQELQEAPDGLDVVRGEIDCAGLEGDTTNQS